MPDHIDILEARESLGKPLLVSISLHVGVFALVLLQGALGIQSREQWGSPDSLGGSSVGITPVSQIPIPGRSGPLQPLASDTESRVPEPPAAKPKPKPKPQEPDPAAVAIPQRSPAQPKSPARKPAPRRSTPAATAEETRGQVYSDTGRALTSPMMGQTGTSGVGIGRGGAFGNRFGYYRDLLEQMIAQRWRTDDVDPRLQTAPPVIVTFVIRRDGSTSNVRVVQGSGNRALDYSALRAVYEASPFPRLPAGYERNEASIEIWFQLQR